MSKENLLIKKQNRNTKEEKNIENVLISERKNEIQNKILKEYIKLH